MSASAWGCKPGTGVELVTDDVAAGEGLWFFVLNESLRFSLEVDGAAVEGEVVERAVPAGDHLGIYSLFLPAAPLREGQAFSLTWGDQARFGAVAPAAPAALPGLESITLDPRVVDDPWGGTCVQYREYRLGTATVSAGRGLVVLRDEQGEELAVTYLDGTRTGDEPVTFAREGDSRDAVCLTLATVLGDGSESEGGTVCSAEVPRGCSSVGGAGSGTWMLLAALALRCRAARWRSTSS